MKTILITGGAGFVGHHLIDKILRETDLRVVTLDRLDFSGNANRLNELVTSHPTIWNAAIKDRLKFIYHDLKSEINGQIAKQIGKVDYIAHVAAASHVDRSIEDPLSFVMDNVVGTTNILNFARHIDGLERFIYFSTDEIFGPAPVGVEYDENARYNSTNPYSATKAAGEELTVAFENTYGLPAIITHTMNVFGERQDCEKFIPMAIRCIRDGEKLTIHSSENKKVVGSRFYIHAADVADAILRLLYLNLNNVPIRNGIKCHKFNVVGANELTNLQLAEYIAAVQRKPLKYELVDFATSRPGHDLRYALSGDKMLDVLDWEPKPVWDRLDQVVQWSLDNPNWL
jgi:dTDP-glucose 4,6-dehydratase